MVHVETSLKSREGVSIAGRVYEAVSNWSLSAESWSKGNLLAIHTERIEIRRAFLELPFVDRSSKDTWRANGWRLFGESRKANLFVLCVINHIITLRSEISG